MPGDGGERRSVPGTVAYVIERYLAWSRDEHAPRNFRDNVTPVLSRFAQDFGGRFVRQCKPLELRDWINARPSWKSRWTRHRVLRTVQACFNWASGPVAQLIDRNPFLGLRLPRGGRGRPMSPEEYRTVLRNTTAVFRRPLVFMRLTGCRTGEMRGLRWDQITLDENTLSGFAVVIDHKTARTRKDGAPRVIPLVRVVVKLLRLLRQRNPKGSEHVFLNKCGRPWGSSAIGWRWLNLRERTGIPEDCVPYGLRHQFGTRAAEKGVPVPLLAEMMGHTNWGTTQTYVAAARRKQLVAGAEQAFPPGER